MKITRTSPRKSRRHDPINKEPRPPTSMKGLNILKMHKASEEIQLYQKTTNTAIDTSYVFAEVPTKTNLEKVFDLAQRLFPMNELRHTGGWSVVKRWDTPQAPEQAAAFHEALVKAAKAWRKASLEHISIASLLGFEFKSSPYIQTRRRVIDQVPDANPIPGIVMPYYMPLNDYLKTQSATTNVLGLLIDIADALEYLHNMDPPVIHGKVKAANVFVIGGPMAVLSDIGLINLPVALDREEGRWMAPELLGTLAPELFLPPSGTGTSQSDPRTYPITAECDIYSFGLLAIELIARRHAFKCLDYLSIDEIIGFRKVGMAKPLRPEDAPAMTDNLWNVIEQCVDYNPEERPIMSFVSNYLRTAHSDLESFEALIDIPSTEMDEF